MMQGENRFRIIRPAKISLLTGLLSILALSPLSTAFPRVELVAEAPATLKYYSAQQANLSLKQIPAARVGKKITLTGKTAFRYVMIQVQSPRGDGAVHLHPASDGGFDVDLLFSRGPGGYRLTFFGSQQNVGRLEGIAYLDLNVTDSFSATDRELNLGGQIAQYIRDKKGVSIGRGECWDAAQSALDLHGAFWKRTFEYGRKIAPDREDVRPGDILQFRELRLEERDIDEQGRKRIRRYNIGNPDHTSIVLEVLGKGRYLVAHQNVNGVRHMLVEELDLSLSRIGGTYEVYRPLAGLVYRHR
ncbi:MAG: hypothetical protein RIF32_21955 [Leptospirales bacterium]|jgi:hypothetical protein